MNGNSSVIITATASAKDSQLQSSVSLVKQATTNKASVVGWLTATRYLSPPHPFSSRGWPGLCPVGTLALVHAVDSKTVPTPLSGGELAISVAVNERFAGVIIATDTTRSNADASMKGLRRLGVRRIVMSTGDGQVTADDISLIVRSVEIGRDIVQIALQSTWLAIALSVGLIRVTAFGLIPATIGAGIQELVDLATILNALRALRALRSREARGRDLETASHCARLPESPCAPAVHQPRRQLCAARSPCQVSARPVRSGATPSEGRPWPRTPRSNASTRSTTAR